MSTENNNQDGTETGNEEGEVAEFTAEEIAEFKAKAEKADQLESEIGSLKRDLKKATKAKEEKPKDTPEETPQSNEPDYAKIAYLNSQQVAHPDDQQAVMEEAERLKLPLTDVLAMEHMKAKLTTQKNEREIKEGMPEGKGRKGGPNTGEVDYYLNNPDKQIPSDNLDLANEVIDAKMKTESNANKWSDVLYTG